MPSISRPISRTGDLATFLDSSMPLIRLRNADCALAAIVASKPSVTDPMPLEDINASIFICSASATISIATPLIFGCVIKSFILPPPY